MATEIMVYMTSVSSRLQITKQQRAILDFLDARGINYRPIDMCANTKARGQMLEKLPEESKEEGKTILPPQVFNGEDYCGDYEQFFDARECDLIYSFFKLEPPEGSSEYLAANPPKENEPEEADEEIEEVEEVEEDEENIDHEAELNDVQPANEDTPMDAEGGEEKMELFAALKKESGEGVPETGEEIAENSEVSADVVAENVEEEKEEEVEYVEEHDEEEVEQQQPDQPVEDTAEVEEYNSDAE